MKTTKYYIVVLLTCLLTQLSTYAQYWGGDSNGSSLDMISYTACSALPPSFFPYMGGTADGAGFDELSNATCAMPASFFPYMGGIANGATLDELSNAVCGIPPSFFPYMGGEADGASLDELSAQTCGFPPQFYAYFGGAGNGLAMDLIASCPVTPPVTDFTGTPLAICAGSTVNFTDLSSNIPAAWSWSFPGGTPATSLAQNPAIVYNTPGTYAVTLIATNYNGSNTKTIAAYVTVTAIPTVTATTPGARCDSGTVTLGGTASAGTLNWFGQPTGGTLLGSGNSFVTPVITATTPFYVEAASGTCTSPRTAVTASVNNVAAPTGNPNQTFCNGETISMLAVSGSNIVWYDAAALGNTVPGNTQLVNGTTYFAAQNNGSCDSNTRLAVTATIGACLGNEQFSINDFKLYPNPVKDVLTITNSAAITRVEIINMLGQMLYARKVRSNECEIEMARYPSGTYLVRISADNQIKTVKVIKE